jgi:type II secretory ATPase GspE/PulE/Tfp pilus assembly ATPase PilB-like protein
MNLFESMRKSSTPAYLNEPRGNAGSRGPVSAFDDELIEIPEPPAALQQSVYALKKSVRRFGRVAAEMQMLDEEGLDEILAFQQANGGRFGEIAVRLGLLSDVQVRQILDQQQVKIIVDAREEDKAPLLTWFADLESRGISYEIEYESADRLVELRKIGAKQQEADYRDLKVFSDAKQIFIDAAAIGASDVCLLVRPGHGEVQVRTKDDYMVAKTYSTYHREGEALSRSAYTGLATVKGATYNELSFQDAQINGEKALPGTGLSSIRIIRGPMYPKEENASFIVARLQYHPDAKFTAAANDLKLVIPERPTGEFKIKGLTQRQIELWEELLSLGAGVALVTGPTGSGKTSAVHQSMKQQARLYPTARQVTIENPTEYPMPWAIQLESEGQKDFMDMVARALRMDPDIMLLGEIRAADEAVAVVQAAMTGHFVWTTLHVTDPYTSIARLEMLDTTRLSKAQICDPELIVAMISIRVVPILCENCRVSLLEAPQAVPPHVFKNLRTWTNDLSKIYVRGCGCSGCNSQGVVDREAVAEIVLTDNDLMADFQNHSVSVVRANHRKKPTSDKSMLENVMDKVLEGRVDPLDAHRKVTKILARDAA